MATNLWDRNCKCCGKVFGTADSRKIYCSPECKIKHRNAIRPTSKCEERSCVVCGSKFIPNQVRGVGRKWCKEECRLTILRGYKPLAKEKEIRKKAAHAEYMRTFHKKYPLYDKERGLKRKYGISLNKYNQMLLEQNGLCSICGKPEVDVDKRTNKVRSLAVDHNHKTGKVRGLLCRGCNQGIGNFKEDLERLRAAVAYLETHDKSLRAS